MAQKVLRFTQDEAAAKAEVERLGGRIIHQFTPAAFVAELPAAVDLSTLTASSAQPTQPVDATTQLAVDAWTTATAAKQERIEGAPSPTEGLPWDTPGFQPPRGFTTPAAATRIAAAPTEVSESTGTPTSLYMVGSVAVGLVLVSRDSGAEAMTSEERIKIVQEVQEGLDWLATVEPRARVSFVYDIRPVTVTSAPGPYIGVTDPYEQFERDWRDAALAAMGYPAGGPGYLKYVNDLRAGRHTDWAYVAFFTKYPLNHFAYAVAEKVVMNYANDGWGPDRINRVFAHESCHIFGAADEYGSCVCGGASGQLGVPNNNCVNCFPPGTERQLPCLMNQNTLAMCDFSRRQIGWDPSLFHSMAKLAVRRGNQIIYQAHISDTTGSAVFYGNGNLEDQYLVGDWTGDGKAKLAVRRGRQIIYQAHITDTTGTAVSYGNGNAEDQYLAGDWTGDGKAKLAVRRGRQIIYQTHITDTTGTTVSYGNGNAEDQYLVGDWTGDGKAKLAVRRGRQIIYQTHISDTVGTAVSYGNGNAEDQYLVGDWTGDGKAKLAVRRGRQIIYQTHISDTVGTAVSYGNGNAEDQYLAGDWTGGQVV